MRRSVDDESGEPFLFDGRSGDRLHSSLTADPASLSPSPTTTDRWRRGPHRRSCYHPRLCHLFLSTGPAIPDDSGVVVPSGCQRLCSIKNPHAQNLLWRSTICCPAVAIAVVLPASRSGLSCCCLACSIVAVLQSLPRTRCRGQRSCP